MPLSRRQARLLQLAARGKLRRPSMWPHVDAGDRATAVIAMIEDPEALEVLDAILAVDGIDGFSRTRRSHGDARCRSMEAPVVRAAIERVTQAAGRRGSRLRHDRKHRRCRRHERARRDSVHRRLRSGLYAAGSREGGGRFGGPVPPDQQGRHSPARGSSRTRRKSHVRCIRSTREPRPSPQPKACRGNSRRGYGRFHEEAPQESAPEGRTWYLRGQNFIVAYTFAEPGAVLAPGPAGRIYACSRGRKRLSR